MLAQRLKIRATALLLLVDHMVLLRKLAILTNVDQVIPCFEFLARKRNTGV